MSDLDKIFKAYDIRGVVPGQLDEDVAEAVGAAFVRLTGAAQLVTLHDMRASSAPMAAAVARGAASQGANVIQGGLDLIMQPTTDWPKLNAVAPPPAHALLSAQVNSQIITGSE